MRIDLPNLVGKTIVTGSLEITGSTQPGTDASFDFGSSTKKWRNVFASAFSGSLTQLSNGQPYLVGTGGVVITTGSNGSVTMSLGTSTYTTASFTNATSVLVNHAMGTTIYDIEVFDTSYSKIIPMTATATTPTQANITFAIPTSGYIAVGGPTSGVSGAGLLQAAIYSGANSVTQTSVGLDTPINVQNTLYSLGNEITRPTNSRFTLSGPGTYRLQAVIGLVDSAQNYSGYRWYDVTNSAYIGTQGYAEDAAGGLASSAIPVAYVTISSATTYELRQNFSVTVSSVYDGQIQVEITKVTGFTSALGITQTVGNAPYYGARAWVSFNGTGTVAIRGSQNVTSITDLGVGEYTVNLTVALDDANYTISPSVGGTNAVDIIRPRDESTARTTTAFRLLTITNGFNAGDAAYVNAVVFR